jgi:hypothetical protein
MGELVVSIRKWLVAGILCVLPLLAILLGCFAILSFVNSTSPEKREEMRQATKHTIRNLAREIDEVSKAKGRLPADERELVAWLGKRLPVTAWGDPIGYYHAKKEGKEAYFLNAFTEGFNGIIYSYSSADKSHTVKTQAF